MPTVSLYVRKGDMPGWKALPNKTQRVHDIIVAYAQGDAPTTDTKPAYDRSEYLQQQAAERAITGKRDMRPEKRPQLVSNGPDEPELFIPAKEPAPLPPAINNIPESIRDAFVPASSVTPPPPKELQACCKGKEPCKHWVWDVNNGDGYVNSLTGEKKEVT